MNVNLMSIFCEGNGTIFGEKEKMKLIFFFFFLNILSLKLGCTCEHFEIKSLKGQHKISSNT